MYELVEGLRVEPIAPCVYFTFGTSGAIGLEPHDTWPAPAVGPKILAVIEFTEWEAEITRIFPPSEDDLL